MCDELACRIADCSEHTGKPVAQNNSETMLAPTELPTTKKSQWTDKNMQGNLLHNCEQKIENLPDHPQLFTLYCNVGTTKTAAR